MVLQLAPYSPFTRAPPVVATQAALAMEQARAQLMQQQQEQAARLRAAIAGVGSPPAVPVSGAGALPTGAAQVLAAKPAIAAM